jgi:hypothetical protein
MLILPILIGALAAYYFGLRYGAWAAIATFGLCAVAMFLPRYAIPLYLAAFAGAGAIWYFGSRRPRPPDAVLAVRWARRSIKRAWSSVSGDRDRDRKR